MSEEKKNHRFDPAGEPPISVPPVEEAWPLMQQKLDVFMPALPWYKNFHGWHLVTAVSVSAVVTASLFIGISRSHNGHHKSAKSITNSPSSSHDSLSQDIRNIQHIQDTQNIHVSPDLQNIQNTQGKQNRQRAQNTQNTQGARNEEHTNNTENTPINKNVAGAKELAGTKELAGNRHPHPNKDKPASFSTAAYDNKNSRVIEGIVFSHPNHGRGNPHRYRQSPSAHHRKDKSSNQVGVSPTKASPINSSLTNSSFTNGTYGQKGLPHQRNSLTTAHPSLIYTAFTLEKAGTAFSGNSEMVNDSVLKNIRLPRKKLVAGNIPAGNQKTNAGKQKKPFAKKEQGTFMSAGLTIGKNFPIGGQQSAPYNINAGSSRLMDYIPAPYFRFDINNRIYLEAAFQFSSPQYTASQLIDSTSDSVALVGSGPLLQIKTITLEKLYYTNIPLTVHYRLFEGLYLGAGLQFSRLWGGVASENGSLRPTNAPNNFVDSARTASVFSLKSNSRIYGKLKKDDWRILLEASYTWKRFSLGLRYQQALNPYLPVLPDGSKGKDKNTSLTLHLDYDLWRQQRKK